MTLPALSAVALHKSVVLKGEPGSGKSTFLNHLGVCLALHRVEPDGGWLERLPDWPRKAANLVPVFVILRDFAGYLRGTPGPGAPQQLWGHIEERLKRQRLDFATGPLSKALDQGQALLLLDGLDEIPDQAQRTAVHDAIVAFLERYPKSRVLVTCRTLAYEDPAVRLEGLPDYELARFDEEKVDAFIDAWYRQLDLLGLVKVETAATLAERLREAVRRRDLWRLAHNPLLLTVMALVHTHKGRLPDARASLYEDTVDILLWRWDQVKAESEKATPVLRQLLLDAQRTDVDLKRVLWRLAFEAQATGMAGGSDAGSDGDTVADIGEHQLHKALAALHPQGSLDWAVHVIHTLKLRAGLLLERAPEVYTFPHRTFQEYLAGSHLAAQTDFARQASTLMVEPTKWREAILLAVSRLVYISGDVDKALALVAELCPFRGKDEPVAWQRAWLAGQALEEIGLNRVRDSNFGQERLELVQSRLAELLGANALSPRERVAGNVLARLGDPRFRPDAWFLPSEPLLGFVEIPQGPFLMGTNEESVPEEVKEWLAQKTTDRGLVPETPMHEVGLPGFFMGRYPVTVGQFRAFVDAQVVQLHYRPPLDFYLSRPPTHQMVGVNWYEAMLYCEWLTETLRAWSGTPEPLATLLREGAGSSGAWRVTLPTEAQWEKAARGIDGRLYSWGNEPDPNSTRFGHGLTQKLPGNKGELLDVPVGCFTRGASPFGIQDTTGTFEWTRSLFRGAIDSQPFLYPYDPADGRETLRGRWSDERRDWDTTVILRGGDTAIYEHLFFKVLARPTHRTAEAPFRDYSNVGFRLSIAPVDDALEWIKQVYGAPGTRRGKAGNKEIGDLE